MNVQEGMRSVEDDAVVVHGNVRQVVLGLEWLSSLLWLSIYLSNVYRRESRFDYMRICQRRLLLPALYVPTSST